jgi:hypothetical protein
MDDQLEKEIQKINAKLRAGYPAPNRGSLYFRATFPPKAGELTPKQRDYALRLKDMNYGHSRAAMRAAKPLEGSCQRWNR